MQQWVNGYTKKNLRSPLVSLYLLTYNIFMTVHLGIKLHYICRLDMFTTQKRFAFSVYVFVRIEHVIELITHNTGFEPGSQSYG